MALSATQRTLKAMREQGRIVDICEKWVRNPVAPGGGFRKDLFGFLDLIILDPAYGIVGVQSCGQSFSAHIHKMTDSECTGNVIEWLKCGGHIELWGWRKVKLKRGGKAMRWKPRIADFYYNTEGLIWQERK